MNPIYGPEKSAVLINRFNAEMTSLFEKNASLLPDDLAKRHAVNPLFLIALKKTLFREISEIGDFEQFVLDIIFDITKSNIQQKKRYVGDSKTRWQNFIEDKQRTTKLLYDNDYFLLETTHADRIRYGYNLHRCLYLDILKTNNQLELLSILCKFELIYADYLKSWITLSRQKSIAEGDDVCAFRFINIDP